MSFDKSIGQLPHNQDTEQARHHRPRNKSPVPFVANSSSHTHPLVTTVSDPVILAFSAHLMDQIIHPLDVAS